VGKVIGMGMGGLSSLNCFIQALFIVLVFLAYDEYEVSPYEELEFNLVRNIEMSRMASIQAGRVLLLSLTTR